MNEALSVKFHIQLYKIKYSLYFLDFFLFRWKKFELCRSELENFRHLLLKDKKCSVPNTAKTIEISNVIGIFGWTKSGILDPKWVIMGHVTIFCKSMKCVKKFDPRVLSKFVPGFSFDKTISVNELLSSYLLYSTGWYIFYHKKHSEENLFM